MTLDTQAKKANPLANTVKATDIKSVPVATVVYTSIYIKQVLEVKMTKIPVSQ